MDREQGCRPSTALLGPEGKHIAGQGLLAAGLLARLPEPMDSLWVGEGPAVGFGRFHELPELVGKIPYVLFFFRKGIHGLCQILKGIHKPLNAANDTQ